MKSQRSNNKNKSKSITKSGSQSRATKRPNKWQHTMLQLKPQCQFQLSRIKNMEYHSHPHKCAHQQGSTFLRTGLTKIRPWRMLAWDQAVYERPWTFACQWCWSNRMAGLGWTQLESWNTWYTRWFKPPEFWEHLTLIYIPLYLITY